MKQKLMYTLLGMTMATVMYTMMPSALAAVSKQIQVTYNNIKVIVDGKELYMTDSANKRIEPFVSDGNTYLPVNAIAKAFDKPVQFDNKTQTLYIGKMPEGKPAAWLSGITPISSQRYCWELGYNEAIAADYKSIRSWDQASDIDNTEERYKQGLLFNLSRDCWITNTYYLKMKYTKLRCKIVVHNSVKDKMDTVKVVFYSVLNGKVDVISQTKTISNGTLPFEMNVDVENVEKFAISVESCDEKGRTTVTNGSHYSSTACIGVVEPALYQ